EDRQTSRSRGILAGWKSGGASAIHRGFSAADSRDDGTLSQSLLFGSEVAMAARQRAGGAARRGRRNLASRAGRELPPLALDEGRGLLGRSVARSTHASVERAFAGLGQRIILS